MAFGDYDDVAWHLNRLRDARDSGRLVFVLGSGISKNYGLPDWDTLIVELLQASGRVRHASAISDSDLRHLLSEIVRDPLLQAAAVRHAYARPEQWLSALKSRLTGYRKSVVHDERGAIAKIARLIAEQYQHHEHRHVPVLTFNYDDLLECALENVLGTSDGVTPIATEKAFYHSMHRAGIFIYHLHGFIHDPQSDIVLDAASYVSVLAAPGRHWSWHCMNTYLFQHNAASLFLGLSLVDPSLRLLLTQAAARGLALSGVYVSKPFPELQGTTTPDKRQAAFAARDILSLFADVLKELSLIPYHVSSWDEIPALLDIIAKKGAA